MVRTSVLLRADLPRGFHRVSGQHRPVDPSLADPSLGLCGARFDSGRFRLAVHRVAFSATGNRGGVRSEVVAYEPGHVEHALAELEAAAHGCARPVKPSAEQQPDLLVLRLRVTGPDGLRRHDLMVERRGDVVSLLEVDDRLGGLTLPLARRVGNRLEARQPVS